MTYEEFLRLHVKEAENLIRETPAYLLQKKQGQYTVDDYYNMPDDVRVELIDGELYYMEAPSFAHQVIAFQIGFMLEYFVKRQKGDCTVMALPLDVRLDCDDRTMVQPDVLVVCDDKKKTMKGVVGAPDFVVEILSPSTGKKDLITKLKKYKNAGVKEYWIVDLDKKTITVHFFAKTDLATIYGFEDEIPVGIFQGECVVDFSVINELLGKFAEEGAIAI